MEACKAAGHQVALPQSHLSGGGHGEPHPLGRAGPGTFAWYTTYENIGYCKPNPDYYREILRYLDCRAEGHA